MKYELICLARKTLLEDGVDWTPERLIYEAHCYDEQMVSIFVIKQEFEDALYKDGLSSCIEDFCLAILSGRAVCLEMSN